MCESVRFQPTNTSYHSPDKSILMTITAEDDRVHPTQLFKYCMSYKNTNICHLPATDLISVRIICLCITTATGSN